MEDLRAMLSRNSEQGLLASNMTNLKIHNEFADRARPELRWHLDTCRYHSSEGTGVQISAEHNKDLL